MNSWYDVSGISKVTELRADQQSMQPSIDHIHSIIQAEIEAGVPRYPLSMPPSPGAPPPHACGAWAPQ